MQNRMLLVASYLFYASWDWRFLTLILITTCTDYLCGRLIFKTSDQKRRKVYLFTSCFINLGILGFFKYFNFFADSLQNLGSFIHLDFKKTTLDIVLPVGISFYTFRALSYSIDIYRKKISPVDNFLDFALFVSFFPQLFAGPIERAKRLLPQIKKARKIEFKNIKQGLWLIFWGYFLKVFVADNLAEITDRVFSLNGMVDGSEALIGTYAFTFQIFGDFAGYSSIAIGLGKLMGFELMTNFLFPYFVTNPRDFWRNWHISLSTWLRDYLYISLGGNRGSSYMTYRNLFITMLLGGLWHGAAWNFVIWGAYHGVILAIHRAISPWLSQFSPRGLIGKSWIILKIVFMFHVTAMGWLIFRSQTIDQIVNMLYSIFFNMAAPSQIAIYYFCEVAFGIWLLLLVQFLQKLKEDGMSFSPIPKAIRVPVFVTIFYSILIWGNFGAKEFIYFQF
jgi:D-alanyl-lipoteichoic acid acyltransferase DltB (MBOAT superfamily)